MPFAKLLAAVLGLAASQAFACYTVFDSGNRVLYHSERPPVDMSRPLHETLPARFPGGHLVFDSNECTVINSLAIGNGGMTAPTAPLLTDEKTARKMRAPHRTLRPGIALVQPAPGDVRPGVTVVPSTSFAARGGEGDVVITEYRNPPLTVVRRGESVAVVEMR